VYQDKIGRNETKKGREKHLLLEVQGWELISKMTDFL
jgi:hypothetical protein